MNNRAMIKVTINSINHMSPDHFVTGSKGEQIRFGDVTVVSANINFQEQILELMVEHPSFFKPFSTLTNMRLENPK